jgi:hypothetical protein
MFYLDILRSELDDLAQFHTAVRCARKHYVVSQCQFSIEKVFHSAMILAIAAVASDRFTMGNSQGSHVI